MKKKNNIILIIFIAILLVSNIALASEHKLRIISYNVQGLPKPIMLSHRKIKKMPKELKKFDADIIAFQETFTKSAKLLSRMSKYPYHAYGTAKKRFKLNSGLLIVSKFPIISKRTFKYTTCSGFDCFAQKGILAVTIKLPNNKLLDVITTHLNAGDNSKKKWHQLKELKNFMQKYSYAKTSILLGDFNIPANSEYYNYISNFSNLEDTHQIYKDNNPDLSINKKNSYTFYKKGLFGYIIKPKKIDFIWVKNDGDFFLETLSSKVIMNNKGSKKLSDHYALMVDFEL